MEPKKAAAYREKGEARVKEIEVKIASLRARAKQAGADAKAKYLEQIERVEKQLGQFRTEVKRVGQKGEDVAEKVRDKAEAIWEEMHGAVDALTKKIK